MSFPKKFVPLVDDYFGFQLLAVVTEKTTPEKQLEPNESSHYSARNKRNVVFTRIEGL